MRISSENKDEKPRKRIRFGMLDEQMVAEGHAARKAGQAAGAAAREGAPVPSLSEEAEVKVRASCRSGSPCSLAKESKCHYLQLSGNCPCWARRQSR